MVELKNKMSSLREENRKLRQQMQKNKMDSGEIEAEQDRSLYNLLQEYMMENQSLRTSNKVPKITSSRKLNILKGVAAKSAERFEDLYEELDFNGASSAERKLWIESGAIAVNQH